MGDGHEGRAHLVPEDPTQPGTLRGENEISGGCSELVASSAGLQRAQTKLQSMRRL